MSVKYEMGIYGIHRHNVIFLSMSVQNFDKISHPIINSCSYALENSIFFNFFFQFVVLVFIMAQNKKGVTNRVKMKVTCG